jgi:hypothetical protein
LRSHLTVKKTTRAPALKGAGTEGHHAFPFLQAPRYSPRRTRGQTHSTTDTECAAGCCIRCTSSRLRTRNPNLQQAGNQSPDKTACNLPAPCPRANNACSCRLHTARGQQQHRHVVTGAPHTSHPKCTAEPATLERALASSGTHAGRQSWQGKRHMITWISA